MFVLSMLLFPILTCSWQMVCYDYTWT